MLQKYLYTSDQAWRHHTRQTFHCRASLCRKAVRLPEAITSKTSVSQYLTTDRTLANADIYGDFSLRKSPFLEGINLASMVTGQVVVSF